MFLKHMQIAPARLAGLLKAAEAAARAIPPAFPLDATVAVNPFLGQSGEDLATASARLARVAGVQITRPRADYSAQVREGGISDDDLAVALIACPSPIKPADLARLKASLTATSAAPRMLPTVADLAARATGTDWPSVIARSFGLWAAGHFDRGQALWSPAPMLGAFAAWRAWASHDLTPEIAGLTGFCAHAAGSDDTPERVILRAADRLGLSDAAAETAFHRLLMDLGGWSQHARWLLWEAELKGQSDMTLIDLLAIRLIWEEALLAHAPQVAADWALAVAAHGAPVQPSPDEVIDAILQEAAERAHQRKLDAALSGPKTMAGRPALQAAFCIDVRSEVFRRALESQSPDIETIGFAGFFGLFLQHRAHGTEEVQVHLPVLLHPSMTSTGHAAPRRTQSVSAAMASHADSATLALLSANAAPSAFITRGRSVSWFCAPPPRRGKRAGTIRRRVAQGPRHELLSAHHGRAAGAQAFRQCADGLRPCLGVCGDRSPRVRASR